MEAKGGGKREGGGGRREEKGKVRERKPSKLDAVTRRLCPPYHNLYLAHFAFISIQYTEYKIETLYSIYIITKVSFKWSKEEKERERRREEEEKEEEESSSRSAG